MQPAHVLMIENCWSTIVYWEMTRNKEIIVGQFYYVISVNARRTGTESFLDY